MKFLTRAGGLKKSMEFLTSIDLIPLTKKANKQERYTAPTAVVKGYTVNKTSGCVTE